MKQFLTILFGLVTIITSAQDKAVPFDPKTYQPPYTLMMPQGWDVERFPIPIDFAPSIPYKGVEDIRFTPGWGKQESNEYWSYAFLWNLEGVVEMNETVIQDNLKAYYTGLIGRNIEPRKIPADKVFPVKTAFQKTATLIGDFSTYTGSIDMLDYMAQQPITLYCIVHIKKHKALNKTFVFYEISPRPFTEPLWQNMHTLWQAFTVKK